MAPRFRIIRFEPQTLVRLSVFAATASIGTLPRKMHITLYKTGKIPIPPKLYGGTQRVIYWLGKALVQLGHQVTLISNPGSHIPGAEMRFTRSDDEDEWLKLVPESTDILHVRGGEFRRPPKKPVLVTMDGNARPKQVLHSNTVFVSRRHAENHGSRHFVYNGIDPAEYSFSERRDNFAVFLAKARWDVKNFQGAVQVARQAGVELRVLGSRNWPLNLQRLLPTIRGVRYYGMLGGEEKRRLLASARCLIFPVLWEEPFGLALTEAMASGCYVAGTPYGSLPEIVTDETGVLSNSAAELARAVSSPQLFEPRKCRAHVLNGGFTHLDMARKYLLYYEKILADGRIGDSGEPQPRCREGFDARRLLSWTK